MLIAMHIVDCLWKANDEQSKHHITLINTKVVGIILSYDFNTWLFAKCGQNLAQLIKKIK